MSQKKQNDNPKSGLNKFAKYSTLGTEMAIIIGLGAFGGYKLDQKFNTDKPFFTAGLTLLAIFIAFYWIYKKLKNENKN